MYMIIDGFHHQETQEACIDVLREIEVRSSKLNASRMN